MPPTRYLVIAAFVLIVLIVHLRGRVRLPLLRQLTDQSSILAPYNVFAYLFSAVPVRQPILDWRCVPQLAAVQQDWRLLRDEAQALIHGGHVRESLHHDDASFDSFFRKGWKRFYLKWYGRPLPSAQRLCPRSVALLEGIPVIKAALFVVLPAGSRLDPHRDPFAGSLRFHLGLATPNSDDCRIIVDGEPYSWRDGEAVLFDETNVHEAENRTGQDRLILFCDVERPLHTPVMRGINRALGSVLGRATMARNVESDPIGVVNRFYAWLHHAGELRRRFKRANRTAYQLTRIAVVAAAVALFVLW